MSNFWEELFFKYGPFGFGLYGELSDWIKYSHTDDSHLLRITLDPEIKREEVKVRLKSGGTLEIEWPRAKGEEIPVE
jgi:hypothetical protein